jgi:hypothetical protein
LFTKEASNLGHRQKSVDNSQAWEGRNWRYRAAILRISPEFFIHLSTGEEPLIFRAFPRTFRKPFAPLDSDETTHEIRVFRAMQAGCEEGISTVLSTRVDRLVEELIFQPGGEPSS